MNKNDLIKHVTDKYSEWIEMEGENGPLFLAEILASMFIKEREEKEYYKKLVNI